MKTINTIPMDFEPKTRNRFKCSVKDSTGLFLISDVIHAVELPNFAVNITNGNNTILWRPIRMQLYDPIKPSATEAIWEHLNRHETFEILIELVDPIGTVVEQWHIIIALIIGVDHASLEWSSPADPITIDLTIQYESAKLVTAHDEYRSWIEKNIKLRAPTFGIRIYVPLKLNQYQDAYINQIEHKRSQSTLLCVDRQQGYTTATVAYCLYKLHHSIKQSILIMSSNHEMARHMITLILEMNANSLNPLKIRSKSSNELQFADGSTIRSISATSNAVGSNFRGCRVDYVFMQEYAYYNNLDELLLMLKPMTDNVIGYSYPNIKST